MGSTRISITRRSPPGRHSPPSHQKPSKPFDPERALVKWGIEYDKHKVSATSNVETLMVAPSPVCPYCRSFSYFCMVAESNANTATKWMRAIKGFVPNTSMMGDCAGVATILCPRCRNLFGFRISTCVLEAYVDGSPLWKAAMARPSNAAARLKTNVHLLRRSAGFPNAHLSDWEFIAELEKRERNEKKQATA